MADGRGADPDRVGRPVPRRDAGRARRRDPGAGPPSPDLDDGGQDHDRLGDARQQGPGGHRGTLAVRCRLRRDRGRHPPAERRPLRRPFRGRLPEGPAGHPRHETSHPVRPDLSRPPPVAGRRRRPHRRRAARLPRPRRDALPGPAHRPRGRPAGTARVGRADRRRRGRGRPVPRRDARVHRHPGAARSRRRAVRGNGRAGARTSRSSSSSTPRFARPSRPPRSEVARDRFRPVDHHDRPVHLHPRRRS